jgi:hypothetical protein
MERGHKDFGIFRDPKKLKENFPGQFVVGIATGFSEKGTLNGVKVLCHDKDPKIAGSQARKMIGENTDKEVVFINTSSKKGKLSMIIFNARELSKKPVFFF